MDITEPTPTTEPVAESAMAEKLGINRSQFTAWRKSGALTFPSHFFTRGRGEIMLTPEGQAEVAKLLGHDGSLTVAEPVQTVAVKVTGAAVNSRIILGKVMETGKRCSVKLITARVFARQFRPGTLIQCTATGPKGWLEYEGKAPTRRRI